MSIISDFKIVMFGAFTKEGKLHDVCRNISAAFRKENQNLQSSNVLKGRHFYQAPFLFNAWLA